MGSYLEGNRLPPPYVPKTCSLCGKSQDDVRRMIAATPTDDIIICDECVDLLYEIIHGD